MVTLSSFRSEYDLIVEHIVQVKFVSVSQILGSIHHGSIVCLVEEIHDFILCSVILELDDISGFIAAALAGLTCRISATPFRLIIITVIIIYLV